MLAHLKTPQLSNWCYWNTIGSRETTKVLIDLIQKHQRLSTPGKLFRISLISVFFASIIHIARLLGFISPPPSWSPAGNFRHLIISYSHPVIRFRSVLVLSKYSNSSKHCSPTLRRVMLSFKHNLTKCI